MNNLVASLTDVYVEVFMFNQYVVHIEEFV